MKTAKAKEALADVQARHKDILQLEKSIRELRDMFLEMAVLVEGQGEMVNRIEYNVANARDFVEQVYGLRTDWPSNCRLTPIV